MINPMIRFNAQLVWVVSLVLVATSCEDKTTKPPRLPKGAMASGMSTPLCGMIPGQSDPRPFGVVKATVTGWGAPLVAPAKGKFSEHTFTPVTLSISKLVLGQPPAPSTIRVLGEIVPNGMSLLGPFKEEGNYVSGYFIYVVTDGEPYLVSTGGLFWFESDGGMRNGGVYASGISESQLVSELSKAMSGCPVSAATPETHDAGTPDAGLQIH